MKRGIWKALYLFKECQAWRRSRCPRAEYPQFWGLENGFDVLPIHGNLSQSARDRIDRYMSRNQGKISTVEIFGDFDHVDFDPDQLKIDFNELHMHPEDGFMAGKTSDGHLLPTCKQPVWKLGKQGFVCVATGNFDVYIHSRFKQSLR